MDEQRKQIPQLDGATGLSSADLFIVSQNEGVDLDYTRTVTYNLLKQSIISGVQGSTGSIGATGSSGPEGATGPRGFLGSTGATGPSGIADRYQTTSETLLTLGLGVKILNVEAGLNYTPNQHTTISQSSDPANHMHGNVVSYNRTSGELQVDVTRFSGSGTSAASWIVNLSGAVGAIGATGLKGSTGEGATGAAGPSGDAGATGLTGATGLGGATGLVGSAGETGATGVGIDGATGATGPAASLDNLSLLPNSGIAFINNQLQTIYNTLVADEAKSTSVGGIGATGAQALKNQSLVGVLDKILFPDINPTYSEITVTAEGSFSSSNNNNVQEVGATINQAISWNIVKNDLGGINAFYVKRIVPAQSPLPAFNEDVFSVDISPAVFTPSTPSNISAGVITGLHDDVPDQFGFASPNNPNYVYTGTYTDNYVVRKGETSWKVRPTTTAFQKKYNNKHVLDSRSFAGSPLLGNSVEYAAATVTGVYPYYYGKSSTLPIQSFIEQKINSSQANATVSLSVLGTISILFNAAGEYIWLAVHASYPVKTVWYNNDFNKGEINNTGFILSPVEYVFSSPLGRWSTETYNVYVSKIKTATFENIEFRN